MTIRDIAIAFGFEVDKKSEKKANDSIDKLKSVATKALGAISVGFSLVKANQIIEEFGKINAQIKNATQGLGEQKDIQNQIMAAASAARVAYTDIAGLTSKLVQENKELFDVTSAAKYAELTTKLFRSEGKAQGEILALQEAINKSFAKGAVDSETISQILERSPTAAEMLAKQVGGVRSELEQMAADGKISLEQLRDAFLGNADTIEASFSNVNLTVTDALIGIRNQWGLWLTQMDGTLKITQTVGKITTRVFNAIMGALRKVQTWTERVTKALGGAENLLKLLAIAGGAIFLALNGGKILSFLKTMGTWLTGINLKFLAIALVIALVALAIDDFINFMQGNDSLLGSMLEAAGIDADAVRKSIIDAWNAVKTFLLNAWGVIKSVAQTIWGALTKFWEENQEKIKTTLISAWNTIKTALISAWSILKSVAITVFNALKSFWETWGGTILSALSAIWDSIGKNFQTALDILTAAFNLFSAIFTGDWDAAWNSVKDIAQGTWDIITNIFTTARDIISDVFDKLYEVIGPFAAVIAGITAAFVAYKVATAAMAVVQGIMTAATSGLTIAQIAHTVAAKAGAAAQWLLNAAMSANPIGIIIALIAGLIAAFVALWKNNEGFRNFFIGMWEGIKKFFGSIADWFKNTFAAIGDFFRDVWDGIKNFFQGVWDFLVSIVQTYIAIWTAIFQAVGDFFKAIWNAIVSFFQGIWDSIVATVSVAGEFLNGIFTAVGDFFTGIWNGIASFFSGIWEGLGNVVSTFVEAFKSAFTAVSEFFTGIWTGITTFFNGVWDGIKNTVSGVKDFFANVFGAIANIVKAPINFIINGINSFISMLNRIKIPDWVPGIGGKGINLPTIPTLAKGGILPKGQMGFLEGEGAEAVVPLEKNTGWVRKVAELFKAQLSTKGDGGENGVVSAVKSIGGIVGNAMRFMSDKVTQGKQNADSSGLTDAVRSFGADIATLAKSVTASPSTVHSMVTNSSNRSVTQNNYFESTFNGDRAGQKRSSEAMNKNANDATGELARAMAYAR